MWVDILKLRTWYQSLQGRLVQRVVRGHLQKMLPEESKNTLVLGIGYCQPYLITRQKNRTTFLGMPAAMGSAPWPEGERNRSVLLDDQALPFHDNTFDTILLCHSLEMTGDPDALLEACWHALRPDGHLVVMVPNRAGAWARRDSTIFAHGHPYSLNQLTRLLQENNFTLTQSVCALFMPPLKWRWVLRFYEAFEKMGQRWRAPFGGLILVEAQKTMFGVKVVRRKSTQRRGFVHVPVPTVERRRS